MAEASCDLRKEGKPYPRTCAVCRLGPCKDAPPKPTVTDLEKELRSIARWMQAVPDHKLMGGMVLSWGEASKRVEEAADYIRQQSEGKTSRPEPAR